MSQDEQTFDQRIARARTLRQQGQNKKAIDAYRSALQLDPDNLDALNEMGLAHTVYMRLLMINYYTLESMEEY